MTPIKTFCLVVPATLMMIALAGSPHASAESTALCEVDEGPCAEAKQVSHIHETTPSGSKAILLAGNLDTNRIYHVHEATPSTNKARLLTSVGTVECAALFLGSAPYSGSLTLKIIGNFTYTSCELGGGNCSAAEENGPAEISVSGEGHETATVTEEGLVNVVCSGFINCSFNGTGLLGTGKGSLLSARENGEVVLLGQSVSKEAGGFLCPKTSKLDISTTPLEATYIITGKEVHTELCKVDGGFDCPFTEEETTVECDALFLGDAVSTLASPLTTKGTFTYSNCNHECVLKEENGPAEIKVLKEGHETAKVTGEGLVHVVCASLIDCSYTGTGLVGTGRGPLLSTQKNGEVILSEQSTNKEIGSLLCPKTVKLSITTSPLTVAYISN
jgi:hypothetical protein